MYIFLLWYCGIGFDDYVNDDKVVFIVIVSKMIRNNGEVMIAELNLNFMLLLNY